MARSQLQEVKSLEKENIRLKRIVAGLRQAVIRVRQKFDTSERRTCKMVGMARS